MRWITGREGVRNTVTPVLVLLMPLVLATCGSPDPVTPDLAAVGRAETAPSGLQQPLTETLSTRLVALDRAVLRWQAASTLRVAHAAAEEARNLIVGTSGPYHGDANRDGQIAGASVVGILPGLKGEAGLASPNDNACVVSHVLGAAGASRRHAGSNYKARSRAGPLLETHFRLCPATLSGWLDGPH